MTLADIIVLIVCCFVALFAASLVNRSEKQRARRAAQMRDRVDWNGAPREPARPYRRRTFETDARTGAGGRVA